jgi:AraC-like DNA-binding protein/mannose-6-phosphate isomerase-like protein (cupin superfamily)
MSETRQRHAAATRAAHTAGADVTVWAVGEVLTGSVVSAHQQQFAMHRHDYHELFWGTTGAFTVSTEQRTWIVTPMLGLFVPAGVLHAGHSPGNVRYHVTEFAADRFEWSGRVPRTVVVPAAAKALLLLDQVGAERFRGDVEARAARLAFDLLTPTVAGRVELPRPADPRARLVADALLSDPADQRTLAEWGRQVGASERTLSRLFAEQTGLSFARWRTNVRIGTSIALLAAGASVNAVARAVGYDSPNSFARAFREVVGQPPRTFVTTNLTSVAPP